MGTNNIDNMANIKSPALNGLMYEAVINGMTSASLKEIEHANTLFFIGADMTEAHPVAGSMARKAIRLNNANLIIANERGVQFNSIAKNDIRLQYALGSQIILINALIKVIIVEKLVDLKKVETSTNNFDKLRSLFNEFHVEEASKITGVTKEAIRNAALLLTKPGNCCIVCGKDIEESPLGADTIRALMNLCALLNPAYSGDAGSGKVSLFFSRSHSNSQGGNDMGVVPGFFPGYVNINDTTNKEKVEKSWGVKFPDAIFKKIKKMLLTLHSTAN